MTEPNTYKEMASSLIDHGIDISDEREVILHLISAGYPSTTVTKHLDEATHHARVIQASNAEQALAS